jgi:hypothetical protein
VKRTCLALAAAAVVAAAIPAAAGAVGFAGGANDAQFATGSSSTVATAARLRRPRGVYSGHPGRIQLSVEGDSISIVAFGFKCGAVTGRTALNDVPVAKRRGRYRFSIKAHGGITYSDDQSPDNGAITFSGRFTPTAKRALGTFRVKTPRCGGTGLVEWSARR